MPNFADVNSLMVGSAALLVSGASGIFYNLFRRRILDPHAIGVTIANFAKSFPVYDPLGLLNRLQIMSCPRCALTRAPRGCFPMRLQFP